MEKIYIRYASGPAIKPVSLDLNKILRELNQFVKLCCPVAPVSPVAPVAPVAPVFPVAPVAPNIVNKSYHIAKYYLASNF